MMKTIFLFLVLTITVSQAMELNEMRELEKNVEQARDKCKALLHTSEEEWTQAESMMPPKSKRDRCLYRCVMERLHVLKDGKFYRKEIYRLAEAWYHNDPSGFKVADVLYNKCEKAVQEAKLKSKCDIAGAMITCLNVEFTRHRAEGKGI